MIGADDDRHDGFRPGGKESNLLTVPKWSGEMSTFSMFKWRFEEFLEFADSSRTRKFTDKEKLVILERALPERERRRLIHGLQTKKVITCQQFLRDVGSLLSTENEAQSLKKWSDLSIRFGGRITPEDLVNFETEFECLRYALPHLTEGECHRHLLAKLPSQLTTYIHEEEARLHLSQPQVLVVLPVDIPNVSALHKSLETLFGLVLLKVVKNAEKKGEYICPLTDRNEVRKALAKDGSVIQGTSETLEVRDHRRELTIPEIFEYLHFKLQNRERIDNFLRSTGTDR